jgi:hypothetical protein
MNSFSARTFAVSLGLVGLALLLYPYPAAAALPNDERPHFVKDSATCQNHVAIGEHIPSGYVFLLCKGTSTATTWWVQILRNNLVICGLSSEQVPATPPARSLQPCTINPGGVLKAKVFWITGISEMFHIDTFISP